MSAAAPSTPIVRNPSTSRRQQSMNSPADSPHRSLSTSARSTAQVPASPHRSQSTSHRGPGSQRGDLAMVPQRDFEQSNVAAPQHASHDQGHDRSEVTRDVHRSARQNGTSGNTMPRSTPTARRRTTISAPSGEWALGKTIGAGSMGKVKLAKHMSTGEQVAVKIVPRQSTDEHRNAADRERADHSKEVRTAREAAIVALVNHPYICGMRDVVRTNHHWYMLFEYVNGGQMLDYIISHGRLKEKQARKFGRQIASALDYCHRNTIVHRDLKIENILISKTGDIKIIDFGLSNLFSPTSHLRTFCGSLYFAAPELLQAKQYTGPEVDIWSFGIVLYVLVCGKVPFDDQSMPQLHAKIKKGYVEYPPWLSSECKNLIGRMLQTDPRQRATLTEIMNHAWITKGFNVPPENYLPAREPLQLPLDKEVIKGMEGFDFGSPDTIISQLTKVLTSDDYQRAVRTFNSNKHQVHTPEAERKRGVFDFYKRRNSTTSRDTLVNTSSEAVHAVDPINAFHPLISIYFLVREKQTRDRADANAGAPNLPSSPGTKPFKLPDLPVPQAAYTNSASYEMTGEAPTGGRSRPRARTHGEDEVTEDLKSLNLATAQGTGSPAVVTAPADSAQPKKESAAVGLLRRFSTRRHKQPDLEKIPHPPPPPIAVLGVSDVASEKTPERPSHTPLRKSFSVRRSREKEAPSSASLHASPSKAHEPGLLSPNSGGDSFPRRFMSLSRSTSVDDRRRRARRNASEGGAPAQEPPPTSGSDGSGRHPLGSDAASDDLQSSPRPRTATSRTKSLGHARHESIQARRAQRDMQKEVNVPEETDQDLIAHEEVKDDRDDRSLENIKPVYLKGLFSVSTTSGKPLTFIRADIVRVLKQLGVEYTEIKGGFSCRHAPSIDMKHKGGPSNLGSPSSSSQAPQSGRRKISFRGLLEHEREDFRDQHRNTPKSPAQPIQDRSYTTGSEDSDESEGHPRTRRKAAVAGETTTHVQNDLEDGLVIRFEIFIVKVPLLSMHGIQFKKVDGNVIRYKNMAQEILKALKL